MLHLNTMKVKLKTSTGNVRLYLPCSTTQEPTTCNNITFHLHAATRFVQKTFPFLIDIHILTANLLLHDGSTCKKQKCLFKVHKRVPESAQLVIRIIYFSLFSLQINCLQRTISSFLHRGLHSRLINNMTKQESPPA